MMIHGSDPTIQIGANPVLPKLQQYFDTADSDCQSRLMGKEHPDGPSGIAGQGIGYRLRASKVALRSSQRRRTGCRKQWSAGAGQPAQGPGHALGTVVRRRQAATGGNRITLLRDTTGDGIPDVRTVFLDHLNSPFGVALVGQDLYVANTDAIIRYPYQEGQTSITDPGTKLTDLPGGPIDHHWTKACWPARTAPSSMSGSGRTATSPKTESEPNTSEPRSGRSTGHRALIASSPAACAIRPASRGSPRPAKLWAVVNERDEIGPDLVPDYLTSVQDGGFYGWPYSYYGQHLDPRVEPQRPDLVAKAIAPDYALSSHVAPLGLAMYSGTDLPAGYRGGAFVGEHGSWDRSPLNGYKVVFVPFSGGRPSGPAQDVVTGFLDADNAARGRPVGLAVDRSGGLLIADDLGNTVWRMSSNTTPTASKD